MRRVYNKSQEQIAVEWDAIAELRSQQIRSGKDISYDHILTPTLMTLTEDCDLESVVDVGCGCGLLTARLASKAKKILGVDISTTSIRLARHHCHNLENVQFITGAIEDLPLETHCFSLAIANMSLMSILNLEAALTAISNLVRPGGRLAFIITHPCYWPLYWNYNKDWFKYGDECVIEAPFHISLDTSERFVTTHVHRPLERYVNALSAAKFQISRVLEPVPGKDVESKYPAPWEYPRFFAALCVRQS